MLPQRSDRGAGEGQVLKRFGRLLERVRYSGGSGTGDVLAAP